MTQPFPTNFAAQAQARLGIEAGGDGPITYRWYRNGSAVGSAALTNALSFRAAPNLAGLYHCIVQNSAGTVTSRFVTVTVDHPGNGLAFRPRGLVSGLASGAGSGATIRWQIRGNHVWLVSGWESNLRVFDISDPDRPAQIAHHSMTNGRFPNQRGFDIALVDETALVAERGNGIGIYDIATPESPRWLGYLRLPGGLANSIEVRGRLAYVGNEEAGVVLLNLDDPRCPSILGRIPASGANGVDIDGGRLHVARWARGAGVFDLETGFPVAEYPASNQAYAGQAFDVVARGSVAWLADRNLGVVGVDYSNPPTPLQIGRFGGGGSGVFLAGNNLFGATDSGTLIIAVREPLAPLSLGVLAGWGAIGGARMHGNRLMTCGNRFLVVDVEPEAAPPAITGGSEIRRLAAGASVQLAAPTFGTVPIQYRWLLNDEPLSGATASTLEVSSFDVDQVGNYSVEAVSDFGATSALVARLEMASPSSAPPVILTPTWSAVEGFRCRLKSRVGDRFAVESSTDLMAWNERQTLVAREPEFEWSETNAPATTRFYRLSGR